MRRQAVSILELVKLHQIDSDEVLEHEREALESLSNNYSAIKAQLLRAGATGKLTARHMVALIELMKSIERLVAHCVKGQTSLQVFVHQMENDVSTSDDQVQDDESSVVDETAISHDEASEDALAPEKDKL